MADSPWLVEFTGLDPGDEGRVEALCTLGNGVFATRGAAVESRDDGVHYPGTYAAGFYNRLTSELGGRRQEHESLVNLPNWLPLTFRAADGDWFGSEDWQITDEARALDMRRGILTRRLRAQDRHDRTVLVEERRIVSMSEPHLAAVEWTITPEEWSGPMVIRSSLDASVENRNVATHRTLAGKHLAIVAAGKTDSKLAWVETQTSQSHLRCAQAIRTRVVGTRGPAGDRQGRVDHSQVYQEAVIHPQPGEKIVVEKVASLYTSLDRALLNPREAAMAAVGEAADFDGMLASHEMAWKRLWRQCGLSLDDSQVDDARTLNLHAFHLLQVLSPNIADRDLGVPARGLHGEGYRGHIFWDDLFVFPFLNLRTPDLTRALLLYRYRRLPAARRVARQSGEQGARYPWQSGSDGREETPTQLYNPHSKRWMPDNSRRQCHVGLAVAYNVWQYYQVTADREFLAAYGAEMLVEISRHFAGLSRYDPSDGRYHIEGVMGPDEFHDGYPDRPGQGIDDNAYTNVMVSWLLQQTIDVYRLLANHHCGELWETLGLTGEEVATWEEISRRLAVPFLDGGIIAQFAGYQDLDELDWEDYRRRYPNIGRLDLILEAEDDTPNRYKASKQADVLMLFYLFSADELTELFAHLDYPFDSGVIPKNVDYYTTRTSNGSTLSRVVNAWVLSRTDRERSWRTFTEALSSDVADIQGGTTREGIHLGAMAGTLDLIQRCYLGVEPRDDVLWFNPRIPDELGQVHLSLCYRGHWLDVHADRDSLQVSSRPCAASPVQLGLVDRIVVLKPGEHASV